MKWFGSVRTTVALGLAISLLSGAFVGIHSVKVVPDAVEVDASNSVSVSAIAGFAFSPNLIENVPANTTVNVTFTNLDSSDPQHTFTIIGREGWVVPTSYTAGQILNLAYGTQYPNKYNVNSTASGASYPGTFTSPAPGWYEFLCTESGHFQQGMYGFIAFGMALPANLTISTPNTGPGAAVFIIVGTIVSLTVIALVLGFIFGRRKGSESEMPPERLGYREPENAGPGGSVPSDGSYGSPRR
ncbi:MAG TPA: cupredoxin domain-containing protein [Thermoplasmata archaeon]|nr:cupredoxin domain-containing protein [Thermoplasmata archaeon]HYB78257.1 cupredoxin domain-containing protein [Thermoplasmata archaeon]